MRDENSKEPSPPFLAIATDTATAGRSVDAPKGPRTDIAEITDTPYSLTLMVVSDKDADTDQAERLLRWFHGLAELRFSPRRFSDERPAHMDRVLVFISGEWRSATYARFGEGEIWSLDGLQQRDVAPEDVWLPMPCAPR